MAVGIPDLRGHTEAWESVSQNQEVAPKDRIVYRQFKGQTKVLQSVSPTPWATRKRGSPYPRPEGPYQSLGVRISVWRTQDATPKRGSLYPQFVGPNQSMGFRIPSSTRHTQAWESTIRTQGATPKHVTPYPKLKGKTEALPSASPT